MNRPLIVETTRADRVECRHEVTAVVSDTKGRILFTAGDGEMGLYPRSSIKALQALPLIESGAADACAFDEGDIALACASHSGEAAQIGKVAEMLLKAGQCVGDLECGPSWPMDMNAALAWSAGGGHRAAICHCCSGKHAGQIALACTMGVPVKDYSALSHPVQREIKAAVVSMISLSVEHHAIEGCGIPTWWMPLQALASAFARFGAGEGFSPDRARAVHRIRAAVSARPDLVAGQGRFDTQCMAAVGMALFMKEGADGVYCAALPEQGLGIALKVHDGSLQAAATAQAALLQRFLPQAREGALAQILAQFNHAPIFNASGTPVGNIRAVLQN